MKNPLKTKFELPLHVLLMIIFAISAAFPLLFMDQLPAHISSIPESSFTTQPETIPTYSANERSHVASYAFLNETALKNHSLLWNPLEFCGVPFFANLENRSLSFFTIPFYFLPLAYAFKLSIWMKLFIAAGTAYYVARKVGLSPPLALFTSTAYQMSAVFLLFQISPISDTAPWLPLCYLFAERAAVGQLRYWPLAAMVSVAMILGGSLEGVIASFLFFGIYASILYTILEKGKSPLLPILTISFTLLVGLAMSGLQLWPYWQFLNQTSIVETSSNTWIPGLKNIISAILVSSNPSRNDALLHVGLLHILFLILWGACRHCVLKPHRVRVDLLYLLGLIMYCSVILHFALELSFIHQPIAWLLPACFVLALNSAAVADTWLSLNPEQCNSVLKRLGVMVLGLTIIVVVPTVYIFLGNDVPVARIAILLTFSCIVIALFFTLLGRTLLAPSHATMGYLAVTIIVAEQLISFHAARPQYPLSNLNQEPEFAEAVKAMGGRAGGQLSQFEVPLSVYGIQQTDAQQGRVLKDYHTFLIRANEDPLLYTQTASATLLLTRDDIQGTFSEIRPYLQVHDVSTDGTIMFQSLSPSPRVHVIYEGRFEGKSEVSQISSFLPPLIGSDIPFDLPPESPLTATLIENDDPNRVTVNVIGCGPGVLVLADSYAPGWKAKVDGVHSSVFSVDNAFRGVAIKSGSKTVEFYYEPKSILQGRYISLGAGILIVLGLLNLMYFRLHNRYMRV